jgi:hypothetical protein
MAIADEGTGAVQDSGAGRQRRLPTGVAGKKTHEW